MAEKRVSVRLAVVGGREVRADATASKWNTDYSTGFDLNGTLAYRVLRGATQIYIGEQNEYIDENSGPRHHTYTLPGDEP